MHPAKCEVRLRAMVVDDSAVALRTISSLVDEHPRVEVVGRASDGCEAVDLAMRLRPDIIVMDVQMPRMNGIEATRSIMKQLPATQIILVTLHDIPQMREASLECGARWFVPKTYLTSELVSILNGIEVACEQQH